MPDIQFDILRESNRWAEESVLEQLAARVTGTLKKSGHITFVFSDDKKIQSLNKTWRGKDKPTNVLSFPDGDITDGIVHLGDVVLAFETLERESSEQAIPFEDHLLHLMLHGSLHLLGYDHEDENDAKAMESLEIRLLADLGIKDPYQDGTGTLD